MERSVAFLVLALSLACVTLAEFPTKEFIEQLKPTVEKCVEKTGVDRELVDQFSSGENMADDPKLKCYMKCIFVELDLVNEETGVFRYEKMLNMLPEEMKVQAFDMGHMCVHFKGEVGSDLCQVSYDLHKCWQKKDPKVLKRTAEYREEWRRLNRQERRSYVYNYEPIFTLLLICIRIKQSSRRSKVVEK